MLSIREARSEDLSTIVAFYAADEIHGRSGVYDAVSLEPYQKALEAIVADPNNAVYVAELDEAAEGAREVAGRREPVVVGTFQLTFIQQLTYGGSLIAQVESVFVREDRRSKGIGAAMIEWAIQAAKARGCRRIQLTSNVARVRAHAFYERLGFVASHRGLKRSL